jgi:D-lactate dehydrogenase
LPDAVVFPLDRDEVMATVRLCNEFRIPLTARGRGTGTTGGAVPVNGGVVMSLERMTRIIELDPVNRLMRVEPGVTNQAVQQAAAAKGFFWPPDPGSASTCTIGGNLAFNAAGPSAVKYATTRENTLGLVAVTAAGELLHTGFNTTKGVTGYDLTRLLIGSEGTLAIITEATLKLTPLPETRRTIAASYRNIEGATDAIVSIMNQAQIPAALELLDAGSLDLIRDEPGLDIPTSARALLLIDVDGTHECIASAVQRIRHAASNENLAELKLSRNEQETQQLWKSRKALSPALRRIAPNKLNEDIVVPVGNIPPLIAGLSQLSERYAIPIVNFGHAGNGNIHVNLLYDTQNPDQQRNARPCLHEVFTLVMKLGGTLSGEHGIGTEKMDYIDMELDPVTLDLMKRLKTLFDPNGILNPGKVFPPAEV